MSAPVQLVPQTAPPSGAPNMNYAMPGAGQTNWGRTPYVPTGSGFAPNLNQRVGATPDPMRTKQMPQQESYPDPGLQGPGEWYYGVHGNANDRLARARAETEVAAPIPGIVPTIERFAPDPKSVRQPQYRATQRNSPSTWSFTRPFDQRMARRLNGNHFSMADHRRNYPIYGMEAAQPWRSTVITQPAPWGQNLTVNAQSASYQPNPIIPTPDVGVPNRGWVMQ